VRQNQQKWGGEKARGGRVVRVQRRGGDRPEEKLSQGE
jgi:hypothetical protein